MYTPIIRNRQSEVIAMRKLNPETKTLCMPLVDLAAPSRKVDIAHTRTYIERNISRMSVALQGFHRVLIDSSELDPNLRVNNGRHPLIEAVRAAINAGIKPIPVTGIHRDVNHTKAAKTATKLIGENAMCFRLDGTDIGMATQSYNRLKELFSQHEVNSADVLLLLDLQSVYGQNAGSLALQVTRFINSVSKSEWGGVIVAGYGIPDRISQVIPVRSQGYCRRVEQDVFLLVAGKNSIANLWFGDYTTLAPTHVELDWQLIQKTMTPKVIYTLKESWFVTRGGPFASDRDGQRQYYKLAAQIVALEEFPENPEYSFGDGYIYERGTGKSASTGSPSSWITACVNRHISLTADLHREQIIIN